MPVRGSDIQPSESTPMHGMLTPADVISVSNAAMGLVAIFLISLNHLEAAIFVILLTILGDGLDGFVARLGYGGGPFGAKIDSYADFVAFGIAPATLLFHRYYQWEIVTQLKGPDLLTAMAVGATAAGFLVAGLLRLIRFEVIKGNTRSDSFIGLSIPAAALFVVLMTYMAWDPKMVLPLTWLTSLLMMSRIRYPKIRGALAPPVIMLLLGTMAAGRHFDLAMPKLLFGFIATYLAAGPLFVKWRAGRLDLFEPVVQ